MTTKAELYKKAFKNAERLAISNGERLNTALDTIDELKNEILFLKKMHNKNIVDVYLNHNKDIQLGTFLIDEEYSEPLLDILKTEDVQLASAINIDTNDIVYLSVLLSGDNRRVK